MEAPETPIDTFNLDLPTALSLAAVLSLLPLSFILSIRLIPSNQTRNRFLFFWHAYDALTHVFVEGSFLYHCFFSYITVDPTAALERGAPHFLNRPDRLYGAAYGVGPSARMWREYGKADSRWLGADLGVVALEILTVLLGGPIAAYICYLVYKSSSTNSSSSSSSTLAQKQTAGMYTGRMWFMAVGLAVAELYGGFMTFGPEWLSGNSALETNDPVFLWLYLVFFNILWVVVPAWVLHAAWSELRNAFVKAAGSADAGSKKLK